LSARLAAKIPKRAYVVVNTMENRLYLKESTRTLRDAVCSTGSYRILSAEDGRRWEFKTPRGKHLVQRKVLNPLWVKPDWAFVEEGEPIPAAAAEERFEAGALGRFGLFLGDGYLIHGTLYTRLLGMPVTHGCIRLGDEDLEAVYKAVPVGSPVYIY
jgi:L,D-transpeptidase YbiS